MKESGNTTNKFQSGNMLSDKQMGVRMSNILAAKSNSSFLEKRFFLKLCNFKGISELIRTSLGPRGMDKLVLNFFFFL